MNTIAYGRVQPVDRTRTVFSQVMGYAAATAGLFAVGAYLGRGLGYGVAVVSYLLAFACLIGMRFAVRRSAGLSVALLFGFGLLMGLGLSPTLVYYAGADPQALWQAGAATALFVAARSYGPSTRRVAPSRCGGRSRSVMAMEVIDGAALQTDRTPPAAAVCVLVLPSAPERVVAAAVWLGVDATTAQHPLALSQRRPLAHADDGRISVIAFAISDADAVLEVHLHVGTRGLLVVCPQPVMPALSEVVSRVDGGPDDALIAVLLWIASESTATVQRLAEEVVRLDQSRVGLASGAVRRTISGLRQRLFALQQLWTAHHLVCAPDGELADALDRTLDEVGRRRLRYAGVIFEASSAAAAQLYALLGDTLSRQSAVISERLTLVTVIFLPLTVSSGFFGMNFNWMTDHIGSAAAFVVLGMVLPLGLVAVTVFAARRVSGD